MKSSSSFANRQQNRKRAHRFYRAAELAKWLSSLSQRSNVRLVIDSFFERSAHASRRHGSRRYRSHQASRRSGFGHPFFPACLRGRSHFFQKKFASPAIASPETLALAMADTECPRKLTESIRFFFAPRWSRPKPPQQLSRLIPSLFSGQILPRYVPGPSFLWPRRAESNQL